MALITAPLANFNSYLSIADADAYHADRNGSWDNALDDAKTIALIKASDFLNFHYTFAVEPVVDGIVNSAVKTATALLAFYALTEDLLGIRQDRDVLVDAKSLDGVGSKSTTYSAVRNDRYPAVTAILSSVATPSGGGVMLGRMIR